MMLKKSFILFIALLFVASCTQQPSSSGPVPTAQQLEWQQMETYAFIHFGLNTFNDMEWGYGDTPAETFNPTDLNCEQWVLTLKACGMKGVILTAKHHDGFCLWPTETTDYSIKNSPYKNGQGDVVGELCEACRKHGLKFGVYLSPWDRHQASYGSDDYVKLYHQQIQELVDHYGPFFEFWFDGANGGDGWYGGAKETRSIKAEEYYQYDKARDIIWSKYPNTMIFGGTVPTLRWIGNEEGIAKATQWCNYTLDFDDLNNTKLLASGISDGNVWLPAEVDVSIRPGWFYHDNEQPKSLDQLLDIYYHSVGRNANLLLNFPVDKTGRISVADSTWAVEWYQMLQNTFANDLLKDCKPTTNKPLENHQELIYSFDQPTTLQCLMLQEDIAKGQRVERFSINYYRNGKWLPIETDEETTTIGYKRIIRFKPVEMEKLRIRIIKSMGSVSINTKGY
ncbi:MAG: alpha-L-fucosidase [Bacteroidales bacterium]|nr:alpha-L-fucosidase [Bacteroidales bacterium]